MWFCYSRFIFFVGLKLCKVKDYVFFILYLRLIDLLYIVGIVVRDYNSFRWFIKFVIYCKN